MSYNCNLPARKTARVRSLLVVALVLGCLLGTVAHATARKNSFAPTLDTITSLARDSAPGTREAAAVSVEVGEICIPGEPCGPGTGPLAPRKPGPPRCVDPDKDCPQPAPQLSGLTPSQEVQINCPPSQPDCNSAPQNPQKPAPQRCVESLRHCNQPASQFATLQAGQEARAVCLPNDPSCGPTPQAPPKPAPQRCVDPTKDCTHL